MAGLSPAGEAAVLAPLTASAFISLHNSDPGITGANEVVGGAYARQGAVTFLNNGANPTVASNSTILAYPTATALWGTVAFFGLWTMGAGGVFQGSGAITSPKIVNIGDQVRFLVGSLTITAM